nr:putative RNA-directed DNA polymerase, eukaryota, reverse transcriptase zinc-binding domain protein [Tanacetum cinerariifolium]
MATTQYLHLLVFFSLSSWTHQDDLCQVLGCGEGRCVADHKRSSYHCECNRGWKTMMVAPMPYPSCIVPNCTMNFTCGGRAPLPPPRPPPPRSPINITNACNLVWCGEGECVGEGTGHYCRCHDDAENLSNNSTYICIRRCSFNANCNHLGLGLTSPPSPPPRSNSVGSLGGGKRTNTYTMTQISALRWPPRVTLGRLLPHARGLEFKPRRGGFPSGAKKEWGLSPKAKVRVLHTAQLDVTEDDVSMISMSIFVTNFPDSFSAKDLFHSCKQYGHVVDTFIPSKRSKAWKRFGFVRFINVFNVERLVNNLCTIWVDRFKFHANIARFHRAPLNGNKFQEKKDVGINRSGTNVPSKDVGVTGTGKTYVYVVKDNNMSGTMECDSIPAIVLDDECLYSKDFSKSLLGRVKEFASLSNLKTALTNEGLDLGFLCRDKRPLILLLKAELFRWRLKEEMCFHSKRLCLYTKSGMNMFENFKVIFLGKVFWIRAKEVPGWVPDFLDDSNDEDQSDDGFKEGDPKVEDVGSCGDDSDVAEVPERLFEESTGLKENLKYPTGFTPNNDTNEFCMNEENVRSVNDDNPQNCNVDEVQTGQEGNSANMGAKTGVNLLIVAVYAPHDLRDKRMLWDYLAHVINQWDGADVFNSFIANAGLEEVPLGRSSFTWCQKSATKMSKLDRFLISENLLITCPNISATTLDRYLSDHRPILLRETQSNYGEAPGDDSSAMRSMIRKLKYLKVKIREWNNGKRNNTKRAIEKYKEELEALDVAIDKAMDMAQKAKIKWSIEGDGNSRFFHGVLNKKRIQLNICGIMVDGVWTEKPNTVKHEFLQHFQKRFDKPTVSRAYVNMSYLKSITIDQQMDLESDVSKEELMRAIWDCGTDKSPGPDGFTFGFYRHFWSTIENDVFEAVKHFFTYGVIPKGCNSSFIALILEIPDANLVKDFRPISLIGSIYKIIAKILGNRLVGVLGDTVNEVQSAFIAERQILDGPFILNVVLQWSSRGSIIINDNLTEEFQFFKGLKQGDPLSPFLFILIMESLHLSFQRVVDAGMFMGIKLSLSLNLSHMFYADDVVFLGQWCDGNINTLVHVLECFYRASGLRISMSKSKIIGIHVEDEKVKYAASKLGVPLSVLRMLESIHSHFFNGHELRSNKATWVKWNNVLASKEKGGLGVSSLYALNRCLMLKWVWRFYSQKTSLWARVIKAIYGDDGKVGKVTNAGIRSCWMNIVNEISVLKNQGVNVFDFMRLKLGNGDTTAFWEDNWIGGNVLKDLYARIYALEACKSVTVSKKLTDFSLDNSFRRKTRGGVEQ